MKEKTLPCLRCKETMRFHSRQKFQLGKQGWFFGDLPHLLSGALELDIYYCSNCGKVEFYLPAPPEEEAETTISQKYCLQCGHQHDIDYPKCPFCGYVDTEK